MELHVEGYQHPRGQAGATVLLRGMDARSEGMDDALHVGRFPPHLPQAMPRLGRI